MVAQWRSPTWRGARHVRKFFAQNLQEDFLSRSHQTPEHVPRHRQKIGVEIPWAGFCNPPMSVFFWFRSTGSRPHGPCASPRGSAARPRRGAPPRSMAPKLLKSRRRAPKAPPAGHVFVACSTHNSHREQGHSRAPKLLVQDALDAWEVPIRSN